MKITLQPMLALFSLDGGEMAVAKMLALIIVMTAGMALLALFLFGIIWILGRLSNQSGTRPGPVQVVHPPAAGSTQFVARQCPKCGTLLKSDSPEGLCPACLLQNAFATEGGAPPGTPAFTPPPLAELAKLFPQLEIIEAVGQGGMGAVYKARQPALDRFVALKILAPRSGGDLDFEGRFSREARALAKLSHPNIVAVYDYGTVGQASSLSPPEKPQEKSETGKMPVLHYFIMEFVDGPNLRQVERAGKLSSREALEIIPQICAALQFAHDEGIVHRDIKPENVLLDKKGRVKIADFGLAKILGKETDFRLTGARDVMGTPHYMAPEQVEKPQEVDHRADIYSLGVVFYEMLTGELPIGKFDPPSHKVQIDVRLDDVVLRSLANNPDRRYQHVSEVKTELDTIAHTPAPQNAARVNPLYQGVDYRSDATLFGLPLLHITSGIDPETGKGRVSKGIIAIGGRAQGVIAIGGLATGGIAIGGLAIGFLALGGGALGLISFGGLAIALILGLGGCAIAPIALGGTVLGYMGLGGEGMGAHVLSPSVQDPVARDFFGSWGPALLANAQLFNALVVLLGVGFGVGAPFVIRKRATPSGSSRANAPQTVTVGNKIWLCILGAFAALVAVAFAGLIASVAISPLVKPHRNAHALETNNVVLPVASAPTNPPASAETWAPALEQPDLQKILEEADDLMKHGKYEESLGRHIWLQRHQTESGDYQNIAAITSWVELGRRYPKARKALIEIRDGEVREFTEGRGFYDLFRDLVSINQQLQDEDSTYVLYKAMSKSDPQLAGQCRAWVEGVMLSKGEYQWCYENMGDPKSRLSQAKGSFEMEIGMYQRSAETERQSRKRMEEFNRQHGITNLPPSWYADTTSMNFNFATNRFVGAVGTIIEVQLGAGHADEAGRIRDQALAYMEEPRLKSAISDAEARIQNRKTAVLESPAENRPERNSVYNNLTIPPPGQQRPANSNATDAARETWEPTLAPGAQPDFLAILQEAKDLMVHHQYEEALQRHIWYHNHSISDPGQRGVRNSFALADWVELGRRYPKAMQALIEIRDENARKISRGEGSLDLFLETASINRELGDQEKTRALFKQLAASPDKALAQQCFLAAQDALVSYGDYELCRNFIGEPENRFKKIQEQWQAIKKLEQRQDDMRRQMEERLRGGRESNGVPATPAAMPPPKLADKNLVAQTRQLIEILVATHSEAVAERIRSEALALVDDPGLKSAVEDAEKKIQKSPAEDRSPIVGIMPPVVVETFPASGTRDVQPGEIEVRVRFSKPMQDGSWSWASAWDSSTPEMIGGPRYADDGRTCVLRVRLEPGHTYAWWLNSDTFHNFKDQGGRPAVPYLLIFQTKPN